MHWPPDAWRRMPWREFQWRLRRSRERADARDSEERYRQNHAAGRSKAVMSGG